MWRGCMSTLREIDAIPVHGQGCDCFDVYMQKPLRSQPEEALDQLECIEDARSKTSQVARTLIYPGPNLDSS
jgi:hypothetical protein